MADDPSYFLDVQGLAEGKTESGTPAGSHNSAQGKPWIGIQFECCGVYTRVYRNRQGSAYEGHCPRCSRPIRVAIGPGGTSNRMFRAG